MRSRHLVLSRHPILIAPLLLVAALALPAGTTAATVHDFEVSDALFPAGDANGTFGPANEYPSSIEVEGLPGTVTAVTAEVIGIGSGRPEDIDMALENPDGEVTMLMSDACGATAISGDDIAFDDAAPIFLSQLGCAGGQRLIVKPTNYFNFGEGDDMSLEEGPQGPYLNTMAALTGGEPEGEWSLYVLDDHEGVTGFEIAGWRLSLAVEPPAPAPPVEPPAPAPPAAAAPVVGLPAVAGPPPVATPPPHAMKTGRRAKALAHCKKKKTAKARRACRRTARKLPL